MPVVSKPRVVGARLASEGAKRALRAAGRAGGARRKSPAQQADAQHALLLGPWVVWLLAFFIGQLVHSFFVAAGTWEWICYVGLTISTGIVGYSAWHTTKARSPLSMGHTLSTIGLAGVWLMFAATTGLVKMDDVSWMFFRVPVPVQPTFNLWWMFGGAMALAWNIRQGVSRQKEIEEETREPNAFEHANLDGVRGDVKPVNEFKSQGIFTMPPGMTLPDMQSRLKALESAKGWPRGSTRLLPAPGTTNPRKVLGIVMMKDPLEKGIPWPGVIVKRSMNLMSLIPTGLDADGDESGLWVARPEGTKHGLVVGMTGSGKSEGEKPVVLYTARLGAANIIIDTVKKTQTFGPLAPALHWLITEESTARAVLRRISKEVIPARTNHLAAEGLSTWSLKSSLSLVRLHIEEAWDLVDNDEIVAIALAARSAGIQLTLSLQRPSHDMISTTVREQLGTRRCYGLAGHFGTMVLDDEVSDAGADPEQWKDTAPGMHYMQRGGMTIQDMATARRAYYDFADKPALSIITFADAAQQVAEHLKPLDPVTAGSFGPLWSNRTTPIDVVRRVSGSIKNVTKISGDALAAAKQAAQVNPGQQVPGLPEGTTPEMLGFLAHLAGTSETDMAEAMKVYVEKQGDVEDIINGHPSQGVQGMDLSGGTGSGDEGMDVVESDDYSAMAYDDDGSLVVSSPGMKDTIVDFGDNAPDAEDLARLSQVDPDADMGRDRAGLLNGAPAVLGEPDQVKWTREQLDAALLARFTELKKQGRDIVKGADFMGVYAQSGGWVRTGIYPWLRKLEREQALVTESDDGSGFLIVKG